MTHPYGWVSGQGGRRVFLTLTPLNLRTSARYERCDGHHVPSGLTVNREFPQGTRVIPVCRRCRVPYTRIRRWGDGFIG